MKKLATLFSVLALICAAGEANADILALPDAGLFVDNTTFTVNFGFPPNGTATIDAINSVTIDLTHTFAADVDISLIAPGGAGTFILTTDNGGSGNLGGTYTFVQSGGSPPWIGLTGAAVYPSGSYNAETWVTGPFNKQGWQLTFGDDLGGDVGTWSNIRIDFDKGVVIPEPTSALIMLGAASLAIFRRRR